MTDFNSEIDVAILLRLHDYDEPLELWSGGSIRTLELERIWLSAWMYYSVSFSLRASCPRPPSPESMALEILSRDWQIPRASWRILEASPWPSRIAACLIPSAMFILDSLSPSELRILDLLIRSDSAYSSMLLRISSGGLMSLIS